MDLLISQSESQMIIGQKSQCVRHCFKHVSENKVPCTYIRKNSKVKATVKRRGNPQRFRFQNLNDKNNFDFTQN